MVASAPSQALVDKLILAVALLVGVGVASGVATAPGVLLDAAVERSGLAAFYADALPVGATMRTALALTAGGLVAAIGVGAAFLLRFRRRAPLAVCAPVLTHEDEDAGESVALLPPPPVVRRADAHPDAPPRRPIRASSEFGAPLPMAAEESARPITEPPSAPEPVDAAPIVADRSPMAAKVVHGGPPPLADLPDDLDQPLSAFDPAAIPATPLAPAEALPPLVRLLVEPVAEPEMVDAVVAQPETPRAGEGAGESIGELLARLERGRLARRSEATLPPPPQPAPVVVESLDTTLERLRRLATR